MSGLSMLCMILFINIFLGSYLAFQVKYLVCRLCSLRASCCNAVCSLSLSLSLSPPLLHSLPQFELYFGLILFCGFILFDTQLIVEKFESGDTDYLWHSIDLFLDFVNIFRRLLIILASKVLT